MVHTEPFETIAESLDEETTLQDRTLSSDVDELNDDLSKAEQRRVMRRIDLRVSVVTGAMYCISLMDRSNLGAASIAGMSKDLKLTTGNRYSIVALIFFIPYVLFEFPAAIVTRVMGPRAFLGGLCTCWGIVMIGFGFIKNWGQLAGLRVLLGVFEAGFFPACVFLLSTYYTRYEVQKRYAVFYLLASTSSAFAGILAYGLTQMNGLAGKAGWRWIFIMEGIITVLVGLAGLIFLVDFPDKAHRSVKFLNQREVAWVIRRIQRDRGDSELEPFSFSKFFGAARDVKLWLFALLLCCLTTQVTGTAFFLPIILHAELRFSIGASQCLVAPPYAFAGINMIVCGWLGDKYKVRGPIIVVNALISTIGFVVMAWGGSNTVKYLGTFLIIGGVNAGIPTIMAYQANNIRGQWTRAFASASLVAGGGLGGISGSLIFRSQDAPRYLNGIYGCITSNALVILMVLGFTAHFVHQNHLARAGKIIIQGQAGFFYTL